MEKSLTDILDFLKKVGFYKKNGKEEMKVRESGPQPHLPIT
jgi:hypothetical protein